jgi:peptidoglycan-associated lipoprotein
MRYKLRNSIAILLALALTALVGACSKKNVPVQPGITGGPGPGTFQSGPGAGVGGMDDARWRELGINSEAEKREFLAKAQEFENQDIYFDYDAYTLTAPATKVLEEKIAFLRQYPKVKVTVEGHCDERGTSEYNLALGERRANTAMQFIKNSGLAGAQLTVISYGKERPIATGHDEASWAKNRRAHFVLNY